MSRRRAALEGLARILDAGAPEELFTGPEDDAVFLYELLVDIARARASTYYWEICRTARRRGVTPEYVSDRAVVLLSTIEERRRADLYRILGVPALSSGETIRQRWLDVVKRHHPDVGGDGARFRQAQQAYEILRDSVRRLEYERFWLRALGPFERVASHEDVSQLDTMRATVRSRPRVVVEERRVVPEVVAPLDGLPEIVKRLDALLAPIRVAEVERIRADLGRSIAELESLRAGLQALATMKSALGV